MDSRGLSTRDRRWPKRPQSNRSSALFSLFWAAARCLAPALTGFTLGGRGGGGGSLKVVTTQASPGYLARNGVPYGAKATFTEYYDRQDVPGGQ